MDIHWEQSKKRKQTYRIDSDVFTLQIHNPPKKMIMLEYYLKQLTQSYIENILPHLTDKTGLIPKQIRYRKMKKWGACTKNGVLIFNSCLICLPISLIEYIVCHELVHLLHFNHSKNFHSAVASFLPQVKKLEKELKMYVR